MKHCENCGRRIYFWNSYHRNYPAIEVIAGKSNYVHFCSAKCVQEFMFKLMPHKKKKRGRTRRFDINYEYIYGRDKMRAQ